MADAFDNERNGGGGRKKRPLEGNESAPVAKKPRGLITQFFRPISGAEPPAPPLPKQSAPRSRKKKEQANLRVDYATPSSRKVLFLDPVHASSAQEQPLTKAAFLTREQWQQRDGREIDSSDIDQTCVLVDDAKGNYLPRAAYFRRMLPSHMPTATLKSGKSAEQIEIATREKFNAKMASFGLSANAAIGSDPANDKRTVLTDQGERHRTRIYHDPVKAGQLNPDVLVLGRDGSINAYGARAPELQDYPTLQSLGQAFGARNVWLKSSTNAYLSPETFDREERETYGADAAATAYQKWRGTFYERQRGKKPQVLVKRHVDNGEQRPYTEYVSLERFRRETNGKTEPGDIVILGSRASTYFQPRMLDFKEKEYCQKVMRENNLHARDWNNDAPLVAVRLETDRFVDRQYFLTGERDLAFHQARDSGVLMQNQRRDGRGHNGNFSVHLDPDWEKIKPSAEMQRHLGLLMAQRGAEESRRPQAEPRGLAERSRGDGLGI